MRTFTRTLVTQQQQQHQYQLHLQQHRGFISRLLTNRRIDAAKGIDTDWALLAGAGLVARHQTPTADLVADFERLGANLADRCPATFQLLVGAQTSDQRLVEAAEHGRRQALEAIEAPL